jgi:hypothetical protein
MSDVANDNGLNGAHDPLCYEGPMSERAMVFRHLAKLLDEAKDAEIRERRLTVVKNLNASIRAPIGEL